MTAGPRGLTAQTASRTDAPTDLRTGVVAAVSTAGIDVTVDGGTVAAAAHLGSYAPAVGDPVVLQRFQDSWVVLGRPIGPGTATDKATPGPAVGPVLLDAMALTKSGSILATSTGAAVTVPRYGVTVYHPPGHWVRLDISYTYFSTVVDDVLQVQVFEFISSQIIDLFDYHVLSGSSWFVSVTCLVPPTFGGVKRNYGLRVLRTGGSGNARLEDHSVRRGHMEAYDLGDQSIVRTA
jgi:hypothetical protein